MHTLVLLVTLAGSTRYTPATQHIKIDEDEKVEVATRNPEGEALFTRKQAKFGTLLKLRADFNRELLKSAE
jgi:hypothetical protein